MNPQDFKDSPYEEIISIARIFSEEHQAWFPCLKDLKTHDIDPVWVAAVLYLLFDRYVSCVPEDTQVDFYEKTLEIFDKMKEDGMNYVFKLNIKE